MMAQDKTTADLLGLLAQMPSRHGTILPLTEYADNSVRFDPSAGLLGSLISAFTAPGRAYRGEIAPDQMIPEGLNFAGAMTLGGGAAPKPSGVVGSAGGKLGKALDMSPEARMARAGEIGFDTGKPLYHFTTYDFDRFVPSEWRGASFFADTPEGAQRGAAAGGMEHPTLGGPTTDAKKSGPMIYPVYSKGKVFGGDQIPDWFFPKNMTYGEWKDALGKWKSWQPPSDLNLSTKEADWVRFFRRNALDHFNEAVPESEFSKYAGANEARMPLAFDEAYRPEPIGWQSFEGIGEHAPGESIRSTIKKMGYAGARVSDESGAATAIFDPTNIRSINAAFDPAKGHLADLLASNPSTSSIPGLLAAILAQRGNTQ